MVSAATAAPVSASISTPVWAVVSTDATTSTLSSCTSSATSTCESGSGWHKGMSSLVRLAAMIPASCAVVSASPFGSSRSRRAVSGAMRTLARATARRRDCGLPPTSTIRTSPDASTCERSATSGTLARSRRRHPVEVGEDRLDPVPEVVLTHMRAEPIEAASPFSGRHLERLVDRLGLAGDVERIHRQRPLAELLVRARVLGQHQHPVALVDERRLLRDQVHPVEDGVHEQHVVLLVRRDRLREVVADPEIDGQPAVALE